MFPNHCRCCFTKTGILLSLTSKSSHMDGKTLLDYFNVVFCSFKPEHDTSTYICLRCSKALQVAYHFISMVEESRKTDASVKEESKCLGNPLSKVMENMLQEGESSQLKLQMNKSVLPAKQFVPLKLPKSFKILLPDSNKDAGTSILDNQLNNDFKCIICNKFFVDKKGFFEHNRLKHKEIVPFKCKLCNFYTCYTESLFKHYKKAHGLDNVKLNLYQTKQVKEKNKLLYIFLEITYICLQCDFKSSSQSHIDDHLLNIHFIDEDKDLFINNFFNCPSCHRSFNDLKSAKIHYSMYHNCSYKRSNRCANKKYACEKCGKLFDLKSGLFLHRRVCETRNEVNCNFCKLKFTSVLKYEEHLQAKHLVAIKHECEICSKTFSCSEYLTVHRKRHNERYYQCDLCPKNYISNAELKVHKQRIHANKYSQMALLRSHENKKLTKRCFKCAFCEFMSYSSFSVKVHQYNHTGKPYKCPLCPKEFAFRNDLRQHCERHHSLSITNDEMAKMFKQSNGYISRFDAFSKQNNSLEITEINDLELEGELEEFGLTLQDIMHDLFDDENNNKLP
ncbi:zinc finger protein ZFP2 [Calliphora vicina]|uniref:zinc finger protein ZFP2 n=1 Tax=Calliphora vicina TaxID=7373 RepID=UPI00325AEC1E